MLTLRGKSAPHTPGPWIGLTWAIAGPCLTTPVLKHSTSASCRQDSRASNQLRPQPTSVTRTRKPTSHRATPRVMPRRMRMISLRILQLGDLETACRHCLRRAEAGFRRRPTLLWRCAGPSQRVVLGIGSSRKDLMLSALDLARRLEAGAITAAAVV